MVAEEPSWWGFSLLACPESVKHCLAKLFQPVLRMLVIFPASLCVLTGIFLAPCDSGVFFLRLYLSLGGDLWVGVESTDALFNISTGKHNSFESSIAERSL
jgi:hypothetical protein